MSETLQMMAEEEITSSSSDDDPEYPVKHQASHLRSPPSLSSRLGTNNFSMASVQSNLFSHSWDRLGSYSIPDLCSYIQSTPPAPVSLLKWCKGRNGLRHEFLLLKVVRPENGGTIWLRLERRLHESAVVANCIVSSVLSGDTAKLSNDLSRLFDASQSEVRVETQFTVPLPLQTLRILLSILMKESPDYKLYSENCYFFCAVIYENLISAGNGVNVAGAPSKFSNSFAPKAKARIKKRIASSPPERSDSLPGPKSPNVPYIPLPALIEQLPTGVSVSLETEQTIVRHPISSQEAFDPSTEHEPSPYDQISTSDRHSSVMRSRDAVSPDIPDIPPYVRQDGLQETRQHIPADRPPALKKMPSIADSMKSIRVDPRSDVPPSRLEVGPVLIPDQGSMCVGIEFGTVHSGVACGISSDTVEQILWPGRNRKVPTMLVYDPKGRVVGWGHGSQAVDLEKGWIRCDMSKLFLDPVAGSDLNPRIMPLNKEPIDVITDYLCELWENAKPRILERGYTKESLQSADIWLSIPATWNVRSGEMMRDAAYAAGLVASEGTQEYAGGRNRLHVISEPEAAAIHCALERDLQLKPNQSFVICDIGRSKIDIAIYKVLGDITHIAERYASSYANCGSHFLDIYFRHYLEEWHGARNIRLSETNLMHYMHAFTYSQKLAFTGRREARDLLFECFDVSDYYHADLSTNDFLNGQLVVPVKVLRERVFDPIVTKVLRFLEEQLGRMGSVDALILVGTFSANQYFFDRIWSRFHVRLHNRILKPRDPDIATSLGAAQSGLVQSLIQRPIGAPTLIASKSYVIGIAANRAKRPKGTRPSGNAAKTNGFDGVFEARYLVVKGALLKKGVPTLEEFMKTSYDPSDSVFIARIYASNSAEVSPDTSAGDLEHIQDWEINLSGVSSFERNALNSPWDSFDTVFEIGVEIMSRAAHVVWFCDGKEHGRLRLPSVPGN